MALFSGYVTIGEIADVKGGKRLPKGTTIQDEPTAHPYIRVVDFTDDGIDRTNIKYITSSTYEKIKRYTISCEDIYISIAGTIGRVGIVPQYLSGANLTENAAKITNIDKSFDRRFLVYYLRSPQGKAEITSKIVGTSQPKLALFRIKEIKVPKVSLTTQRKIAAILSAYDDLIENNTRRIKIMEEMAQLIYREWFVKFRFPGHEKVRMVDSELGPIPEGWEVYSYKELVDLCIGGDWGSEEPNDKENIEVCIVRGADFDTLFLGNNSELPRRYVTPSSFVKRKLKPGDIIIENSVNAKSRSVGKSLLITNGFIKRMNGSGICSSFCKLLRLKEPRLAPIAYLHMKHLYNEGKMQYYQNVATNGIGNFQATRFIENEAVIIPGDEELLQFIIETLSSVTSSVYSDKNFVLHRTRYLLLPKLISGELDVEDLDIAVEGD